MISLKFAGRVALVFACAVVLASCGKSAREPSAMAKYNEMKKLAASGNCTGEPQDPAAASFAADDRFRSANAIAANEAEAFLSGRTSVSYDFGRHGTQIEYTGADGSAHLWYPGNSRILHGRWKIDRSTEITRICFAYEGGGYNPETGHSGDDFECGSFQHFQFFKIDSKKGDVFNLEKTSDVRAPLPKNAAEPYVPSCMPFLNPYITNGKPPIEHMMQDIGTAS